MKPDLSLELPVCEDESFPPPHLDNARYLEFIEFNQRIARENGTAGQIIRSRAQPVDAVFVLP